VFEGVVGTLFAEPFPWHIGLLQRNIIDADAHLSGLQIIDGFRQVARHEFDLQVGARFVDFAGRVMRKRFIEVVQQKRTAKRDAARKISTPNSDIKNTCRWKERFMGS
jgi:hypothetical protein